MIRLHPDEAIPFELIKAYFDAVNTFVCDRRSPSFIEIFFH